MQDVKSLFSSAWKEAVGFLSAFGPPVAKGLGMVGLFAFVIISPFYFLYHVQQVEKGEWKENWSLGKADQVVEKEYEVFFDGMENEREDAYKLTFSSGWLIIVPDEVRFPDEKTWVLREDDGAGPDEFYLCEEGTYNSMSDKCKEVRFASKDGKALYEFDHLDEGQIEN